MLTRATLKNFGPLKSLAWGGIGPLNLVIGGNGSGKTFLLKALFAGQRSLETFMRGNEPRGLNQILGEKLYWTFEVSGLGELVSRSASEKGLRADLCFASGERPRKELVIWYMVDRGENGLGVWANEPEAGLETRAIFLPAKEILTLEGVVKKLREEDQLFGLDETYYDLAKAAGHPMRRTRSFTSFKAARTALESLLGGYVYRDEKGNWFFERTAGEKAETFPISITAEGIRKVGVLDVLLGNRTLRPGSTVYIDEPEANLHPTAISTFLDIIHRLSGEGMQFILASHSYFVIKKLHLIAREHDLSIPVLMLAEDGQHRFEDLKDGMPENPIIDESVRLYEEEIEKLMP